MEKNPLEFMDEIESSPNSNEINNNSNISQAQNVSVRTTCDTI
ncbi:MAG: hypothetical protein ACI4EF_10075 [Coprococcus sp.]